MLDELELCGECGQTYGIGDWPWCPHGKPHGTAIDDELTGGARYIENLGVDPTPPEQGGKGDQPIWIETKTQLRRELKKRNLRQFERHAPGPHGDKSKHTSRWI